MKIVFSKYEYHFFTAGDESPQDLRRNRLLLYVFSPPLLFPHLIPVHIVPLLLLLGTDAGTDVLLNCLMGS